MPVGTTVPKGFRRHRLIRRVSAVRGSIELSMDCCPAFNYARDTHVTEIANSGAEFRSNKLSLALAATAQLQRNGDAAVAKFTLGEGESAVFVLHEIPAQQGCETCLSDTEAEDVFRQTVQYWRRWPSGCTYVGRWREMVHRSALALKLLTFEPTGAIVAAPTCSLPEGIGGERNWDYRYSWIRDSAFTVYALLRHAPIPEVSRTLGQQPRLPLQHN